VPAASRDRLLLFQLQALYCVAPNWRFGPIAAMCGATNLYSVTSLALPSSGDQAAPLGAGEVKIIGA
jgi:hypothetical protein